MRSSLDRNKSWESATLVIGADHIESLVIARDQDPAGVIGAWRTHMGAPGNLGGLVVFTKNAGRTTR